MKASDYIADFLYAQGVDRVFELIGGMTTHLIDSLCQRGKIEIVVAHHEQAAAFAAEGWARMKGIPGVAIATSGPGGVNLLTGIGSCYFDSTPAVFITGQVNLNEQRGDRRVRQLGFQETDIVSMARPITKAALSVTSADEVPTMLRKAFSLALSGRPGPVLVDIPMDVQRYQVEAPADLVTVSQESDPNAEVISELIEKLASAKRPLILAGGGVRAAGAARLLREFAEAVNVPVANSLMAMDIVDFRHPLRVGMIGTYGNRWANLAVGESDVILVVGSRLDVRQTGSETDAFVGDRVVYRVDCDEAEINNRVKGCIPVVAHIKGFLETALRQAKGPAVPAHADWIERIAELKRQWPDTDELKDIKGINPNGFLHQLSAAAGGASAYVVDVGLHQMWAAQSVELADGQRFLTSGGMGSMGFALPAAVGAAMACPGKSVVVIAGDGGFQLNIQELQTVVHHGLPIKMVILNNQSLGMPRMFQQTYFEGRYQSTCWGYSAPNFGRVASAYGIDSRKVDSDADVPEALKAMWASPDAPFILDVAIDVMANAYPKIAFGKPMTEMEPLAEPVPMEPR